MTNLFLFGFENNYFVFHHLYEWFVFMGIFFLVCYLITKFILWMGE